MADTDIQTDTVTVSLPADVWAAVQEQIQWETRPALRQATVAIRLALTPRTYTYEGFIYSTLDEAEAARHRDHDGWLDGRRKCIWVEPTGEAL